MILFLALYLRSIFERIVTELDSIAVSLVIPIQENEVRAGKPV